MLIESDVPESTLAQLHWSLFTRVGAKMLHHTSSRFAQRDIRRLELRPTLRCAPDSQIGEPLPENWRERSVSKRGVQMERRQEKIVLRQAILEDVRSIEPFDDLEAEHQRDAIEWIESGAELCRQVKPATPPKHLVSYFVLTDDDHFLLVEHRDAGLWLPTGGHVEPDELPSEAARREAKEELGIEPRLLSEEPLFITSTKTVGRTERHTDISLWYVVVHTRTEELHFDQTEFKSIR